MVLGALRDNSPFFDIGRRRTLGSRWLRNPWVRRFRRLLWQHLPLGVRKPLIELLFARTGEALAMDAPAVQPVCVAGYLSNSSGIGEGGRLSGRALAALGYNVLAVDVSELADQGETPSDDTPLLEAGPGTMILHFNPDNLAGILTVMGRRRLRRKRMIGYWAWETHRIPDPWLLAFDDVDEVWVPSEFVARAVSARTPKPVRVVPHPVAQVAPGTPRRAHFGIGDQFAVLVMFSMGSSFERKNPIAAVRAFRLAFGEADDRLLILKVSDGAQAPDAMAELLAEIGGAPNIRILEDRLSDLERLDLIASADALLSLHRSEGFGLVMAEAMLAGVPVVATAWSGNLDFMTSETALLVGVELIEAHDRAGTYGSGDSWADPSVEEASAHLAALAADPEQFLPMRRAAAAMVQARLGVEAFGAAVAPTLGPPPLGRAPG